MNAATGNLILAGQLSGAGDILTKIGAGTLYLLNGSTTAANNYAGTVIAQGVVEARLYQAGSNPLGSGAVTLSGANLNAHADGDGTAASQVITYGNAINIGTNTPQIAATSIIDARQISLGSNKSLLFGNVTVGGTLGSAVFGTTGANGDSVQIQNLAMTNGAALNLNGANLTIEGLITGPGTLWKGSNGSSLYINADNSSGYTGGTAMGTNGGTIFFGSFDGIRTTLNNTAKLGDGNILVNSGDAIQFNALTNLNGAQTVEVRSSFSTMGMFRLAANNTPDSFNLRSGSAGGSTSLTAGSGVLAIDVDYTAGVLSQSTFGDGTWYFGSTSNAEGLNGTYDLATLGAGANNLYRLGAGGSTLYIGNASVASPQNNVLTGVSTGLVIGTALTNSAGAAIGNGTGSVVLSGSENYGGTTIVNRGSFLEIRGALASPSFDIYGQLNIGGPNGTLVGNSAPGTANFVLEPGSELRFDNSNGASSVVGGRINSAASLTLNNTTLYVYGSVQTDVTQSVGALTANLGQSVLQSPTPVPRAFGHLERRQHQPPPRHEPGDPEYQYRPEQRFRQRRTRLGHWWHHHHHRHDRQFPKQRSRGHRDQWHASRLGG